MAPQLEIYVDGKGSVFRTAERGVVHLSVSSTSTDQSTAFVDVKGTVETLTQKFRSFATKTNDGSPHPTAGITTFTVSPLNTSSHFQRDHNYHEIKSKPKEHTVRSTAEVVFRNLELLSDISHELANMPHVSIVNSEWRLTGPTRMEIEREARVKAIKDAVQKAEDYAGVVGRQVVAVEIKDGPSSNSTSRPYYFGAPAQMQAQMQGPPQMQHLQKQMAQIQAGGSPSVTMDGPALEPRTITVSAQVNATTIELILRCARYGISRQIAKRQQTSTSLSLNHNICLSQLGAPITPVRVRSLHRQHISTSPPTAQFNLIFFVMEPSVEPVAGIQPLNGNAPNNAIQSDADRVHGAMNSTWRTTRTDVTLDSYMKEGFMTVSSYASRYSIDSHRSMEVYDMFQTGLISIWTEGRQALIEALKQTPKSPLVASTYLAKAGRDIDHGYGSMEGWQDSDCNEESYINCSIEMQMLTAWDESVRQNSTRYFDIQFTDAMATWNKNRELGVESLAADLIAGASSG